MLMNKWYNQAKLELEKLENQPITVQNLRDYGTLFDFIAHYDSIQAKKSQNERSLNKEYNLPLETKMDLNNHFERLKQAHKMHCEDNETMSTQHMCNCYFDELMNAWQNCGTKEEKDIIIDFVNRLKNIVDSI